MPDKIQIVYKLDNIDPEDGVDVFEIAPILMSFGELIRSSNETLGFDQKIDIKVKPFKSGSWITEFVLQNKPIMDLLSYAHTAQGQDLLLLCQILGIVTGSFVGVVGIVRFTKGVVNRFKKSDDGKTVVYENEKGEKLTVSLPEHRLVQSPLVQTNYYNCVVAPYDKFPSTTAISTKLNTPDSEAQVFTPEDKKYFEQYASTELLEDVVDNVSKMSGVFIKPKRGPYSGDEKAYSFIMGDSVIWPVTMEDQSFRSKLITGEVRPYSEDVLKVDIEVHQKKDSNNKIITSYSIAKVIDYIRYEKPRQINLGMEQDELQDQKG